MMRQPCKLVKIMALISMTNIIFFGFMFQRGRDAVSLSA
jgi:hypothetical protein